MRSLNCGNVKYILIYALRIIWMRNLHYLLRKWCKKGNQIPDSLRILSENVFSLTYTMGIVNLFHNRIGPYTPVITDNSVEEIVMTDNSVEKIVMSDNFVEEIVMTDNSVEEIVMMDNSVEKIVMTDNFVEEIVMTDNSVGEIVMTDNSVEEIVMTDKSVEEIVMTDNSVEEIVTTDDSVGEIRVLYPIFPLTSFRSVRSS